MEMGDDLAQVLERPANLLATKDSRWVIFCYF